MSKSINNNSSNENSTSNTADSHYDEKCGCNVFGLSDAEYRDSKIKLNELKEKRRLKNNYAAFFSFLSGSIMALCIYVFIYDMHPSISHIAISVISGFLIGTVLFVYYNMHYEMHESALQRQILIYEANNIRDDMQDDIFENSINMSYKYLDQYYLQTREQAQRGFFVTLWVAVFGALLIGIGVVAMFFGHTEPSYVTCASGVITEFISAVFFYLYNKTVSSMSKYHNKLVLSQNIAIALKVSDSLPEADKVNAKNLIVNELLKDINSYLINSTPDNKPDIVPPAGATATSVPGVNENE